jgi:hypothetical protein
MLHEPHHSHANAERVRDRGDRHVAVRAKLHLECAGLMNGDIETVLRILQAEEPDDAAAALLMGTNSAAVLTDLIQSDSVEVAVKAASLAGHVESAGADAAPRLALSHANPQVRGAAAAALRRQPDLAAVLIADALADTDLAFGSGLCARCGR